jgi:hypothetical protein
MNVFSHLLVITFISPNTYTNIYIIYIIFFDLVQVLKRVYYLFGETLKLSQLLVKKKELRSLYNHNSVSFYIYVHYHYNYTASFSINP